jgi:foldase protein PrsA
MNTLVRNLLIEQEANKQHITVSDKEVDDEIKKIQDNLSKQGQKIDQVLKAQKMTTQDLRRLVRLDKLVGKMVGKDIKVSDKEVNDYIAKNKDVLPQNANKDQLKKQVADQIKTQKTNEKVRTWLSDMQSKAHIQYFVTYP